VSVLDTSALRDGDVAGLALLNRPFSWIGVERTADGTRIAQFDEQTGRSVQRDLAASRIWLRADCDFITERATYSYSLDGKEFTPLGEPVTLVFQLGTFQGIRYSLFAYNSGSATGGTAAFESFQVEQPHPRGLLRPMPTGRRVRLSSVGAAYGLGVEAGALTATAPASFRLRDMSLGRVALEHRRRYVSVTADGSVTLSRKTPGAAESFQWMETPNGDLVLMSLATHRFLRIDPVTRRIVADSPGPLPDGSDGARFHWSAEH
jgi:hypothetical protein